MAGLGLVLLYYLLVWHQVGKDPEQGVSYPQYAPPDGYSPASIRFIREMGYDHKAFTAAIVNLAVKGVLQIEDEDGTYTLIRNPGWEQISLAPGEQALCDRLFRHSDRAAMKNSHHELFADTLSAHETALKKDYGRLYFRTNQAWLIPGIMLSVIAAVTMFALLPDLERTFSTVFHTITIAIVAGVMVQVWRGYQGMRHRHPTLAVIILLVELTIFVYVGGHFAGIAAELMEDVQWSAVALALLLAATSFAFQHWLKAPTLAGRRLLDQLDGFRLYLTVAEHPELRLKNPPQMTPAHFEALLPYAIALGVEDVWGEHFASTVAANAATPDYHPGWYHGSGFSSHSVGQFSSAVAGGLAGAIASSSTAPGSSSSGFSGGGSSGGGGGGGGGGGW